MKPYRGFADLIRLRRKELGLTLAGLADKVGWSIPYLSELERGVKQPPPTESLEKLAQALQLDPRCLMREAVLSRRSIEIDLEGANADERRLAVLLARRLEQGLPPEEVRELLTRFGQGDEADEGIPF